LSAAALVVVVTTFGRLLGFVRDLVIAHYYGASANTDAFLIAWMIPETVTPLLLEGVMLLALMPLFARELERRDTLEEVLSRTLPPIIAVLLVLSAAVALSAPWTVPLLAPGLSTSTKLMAVRMVGIASVTIFFIGLAGYAWAALNSKHIFGVPSAVYAAYNLGILGSIVLLHESLGIYSAAFGLAFGSALMLLVQAPTFVRKVGVPRLSFKLDLALRQEFLTVIPIVAFMLGRHAQVYIERFLGSFLEPGAISQLNYATRLAQFPMSVAIAVALVSFPAVARAAAARRAEDVAEIVESNMKMVSTLILPATTFLMVFAPELVSFLFEHGAFTAEDTIATTSILRIYSLGLLAQTLIFVVIRAFFTHRSSLWLPVQAALIGLAVTVAVDLALVRNLGADGLAAGNAAGITVMALVLIWNMKRRVVNVSSGRLASFFVRAFGAALLAGCCALPVVILEGLARLPESAELFLGGTVLGLAYLFLGRLLKIKEVAELQNWAKRMIPTRGKKDLFEGRHVPTDLGQRAPSVEPPQAPQEQLRMTRWPPILMYHAIARGIDDPNKICVSAETLENQMLYLKRRNMRGVSMNELMRALRQGSAQGLVGLTFDDGYENFLSAALPVLEDFGFTATVFVAGGMLGGSNSWDRAPKMRILDAYGICEAAARGVEIGAHGTYHLRLTKLDPVSLREEVEAGRQFLDEVLERRVEGFCYPYGDLNSQVVRAVREAGYTYACAYKNELPHSAYAIPRLYIGESDRGLRFALKLRWARLHAGLADLRMRRS